MAPTVLGQRVENRDAAGINLWGFRMRVPIHSRLGGLLREGLREHRKLPSVVQGRTRSRKRILVSFSCNLQKHFCVVKSVFTPCSNGEPQLLVINRNAVKRISENYYIVHTEEIVAATNRRDELRFKGLDIYIPPLTGKP